MGGEETSFDKPFQSVTKTEMGGEISIAPTCCGVKTVKAVLRLSSVTALSSAVRAVRVRCQLFQLTLGESLCLCLL